jgi:predicted ATPase
LDSIINQFSIKGLYGERDVDIDFTSNIKIIVAENGYGKTTVLNALYATLTGDASRLRKIDFESIEISFNDGEEFTVKSKDLKISIEHIKSNFIFEHLSRKLGETDTYELLETALTSSRKQIHRSYKFKTAAKKVDIPAGRLAGMLEDMIDESGGKILTHLGKKTLGKIKAKFPYNIVYLPTYRRVEQDFKDLSIDESSITFDDNSINFGMRDVNKRFKEITDEIISSSVEWFSKVNGQMLSQLVEGIEVDDETKASIENPEAIKIVLDRIGNNIEESYKEEIIRLIESKEIFTQHDQLVYFIANLVKVYEQQQSNDKAIQDFSEVCNKYLVDKKIDYNESKVTIDIVRRKNGRSVNIETLSSGEKQIISLFARLYLKRENDLAIFYDEPELSLSLEWQKTLLPDIINSNKCAFMFTTTHSPFIFENELVENTVDLGEYIKEL